MLVRTIFIVALVTFGGAAYSQQPAPSEPEVSQPQQPGAESRQQAPPADQRGTENSPVIVKVLPAPKTKEEAERDQRERDEKSALEWNTLLLGALTLVVLALQLAAFVYQGIKLRQTVKTMDDMSHRQLRAYIDVEPLGISEYFGANYSIGHIGIKNVGNTLAKNVSMFSTIEWTQDGKRETFAPGEITQTKTALAPRAEMRFGTYNGIGISEIGRGSSNEWTGYLYAWGRVTYTDEFGTIGWTNFCHRYPCEMAVGWDINLKHARRHEHGGNDAA